MTDSEIAANWRAVVARVAEAARAAGRPPSSVAVLAAIKTQDLARVVAALDAGCRIVGQNRAQELTALAPDVERERPGLAETHFIGGLQLNKVNAVLRYADSVQSVDRDALAEKLSRGAVDRGRDLGVFVQVNASGEESKGGVAPGDAVAFASRVAALPGLVLRGLMTIGAHSPDPNVVAAGFRTMQRLSAELTASGAPGTAGAHELSMGMSADMDVAIAHGATMVRVGTAIFGPRGGTHPREGDQTWHAR